MTIRGETKRYPVFQIPLAYLFYNDQNGRIATYMNEVEDIISLENRKEYNGATHKFVVESHPAAFEMTKQNIKGSTQKKHLSNSVMIAVSVPDHYVE